MTQPNQREQKLHKWSQTQLAKLQPELSSYLEEAQFSPLSGDASFRRYYRLTTAHRSWICVDAPPQHENCSNFIQISSIMLQQGLLVPTILASNLEQGYMLLSDFGDQLLHPLLNENTADKLYGLAQTALITLQQTPTTQLCTLKHYDQDTLYKEMTLFPQWFLQKYLQIELNNTLFQELETVYKQLIDNALEQPQVLVHRDFHSRNLMRIKNSDTLGIIDFQDAVVGPITYDLVSLLRDCYIRWPQTRVQQWVQAYAHKALSLKLIEANELSKFQQWFDWMGLQRHLKVAGIFARLYYRDGKKSYLKDIPLTVYYLWTVSQHYPKMNTLLHLLDKIILPKLFKINPDCQTMFDRPGNIKALSK